MHEEALANLDMTGQTTSMDDVAGLSAARATSPVMAASPHAETVLFVDLENKGDFDVSRLPFKTIVFYGPHQSKQVMNLALQAETLCLNFNAVAINGRGENELDFHIAYYLGVAGARSPKAECVILSGDKDYDPLVRHIVQIGYRCRRVDNQFEWLPMLSARAKIIVGQLGKLETSKRPRKRKTLGSYVNSRFENQVSDIQEVVDELFIKRLVSEANGTLTYSF